MDSPSIYGPLDNISRHGICHTNVPAAPIEYLDLTVQRIPGVQALTILAAPSPVATDEA
jgi:hypothetical protein